MKKFIITVERKRVKGRLVVSVYDTELKQLIEFQLKSNMHKGIEYETIDMLVEANILNESEVVRSQNGYPVPTSTCKFITFESTDIMYINKNY